MRTDAFEKSLLDCETRPILAVDDSRQGVPGFGSQVQPIWMFGRMIEGHIQLIDQNLFRQARTFPAQ